MCLAPAAPPAAEMAERLTLDFLVIYDFLDGGEALPETDTSAVTVLKSSI